MLRIVFTITLACAFLVFSAGTASTMKNGAGMTTGTSQKIKKTPVLEGTVESMNMTDSSMVIKRMSGKIDTVKWNAKTLMSEKRAPRKGEKIVAYYSTMNGTKMASRIRPAPIAKTEKEKTTTAMAQGEKGMNAKVIPPGGVVQGEQGAGQMVPPPAMPQGEKGMKEMVTEGTIESMVDNTLVIRSAAGMDTMIWNGQTALPNGKMIFKEGERVTVHYSIVDGKKVASKIDPSPDPGNWKPSGMTNGEKGMTDTMITSGKIEMVNSSDNTLTIKTKAGTIDTVKWNDQTAMSKKMKKGEWIRVHYMVINGQKMATKISSGSKGEKGWKNKKTPVTEPLEPGSSPDEDGY